MNICYKNTILNIRDLNNYNFGKDDYFGLVKDFLIQWFSEEQEFEMQTSGSTGVPKKIIITRSQLRSSAQMTIKELDLTPADHALACMNIQYIAGRMMVVRAIECGMDLTIVPPSKNPIQEILGKPITFTALVPYQLHSIIHTGSNPEIDLLNNMKCILVGGAAISTGLTKDIEKLRVPIYSTYGMTETISHVALRRMNGVDKADYYTALPGVFLNVDSRGCMEIRTPVVPNLTISTNDIVELKDEKHFQWKGRIDNVINSGGVKIIAEELEAYIAIFFEEYKTEREFFICGMPDPLLGEKVILIIEGNYLEQEGQLLDTLVQKFGKYQSPKSVKYIPVFNKTPTGKIDRVAIKIGLTEV